MLEELQKYGLNKNQAKTYLAALELGGPSPVSTIAKFSGLKRSTTHFVLEKLAKMGLVTSAKKQGYLYYQAQPPEKLVAHLEQESQKLTRLAKEAQDIIPALYSRCREQGDWPRVYFYEGEEGLIRVYEETLNSSEEILAYASDQANQAEMPHYFPEYYKRRAKKGIPIRAIFTDSPEDRERHKLDKEELRKSYLLPKNKLNITPEINFFDNKIMIADWKEKLGIIIESKEIANAFKQTFELAWEAAEKYHKEIMNKKKD